MYFLDLMGGEKPHLLIGAENNLGARTVIQYVSSTHFYLEDQLAGRPWMTRLPFPVYVEVIGITYQTAPILSHAQIVPRCRMSFLV
jgi:hypothetical protein